jgi:hypothetical protein
MPHDACYHSVKARYAAFPSARASQAIAKCRKASGHARKGPAGKALKRWASEKWVNTKTGRPCGNAKDKTEYCRPSKRVSAATPATARAAGKAAVRANYRRKQAGVRARTVGRR